MHRFEHYFLKEIFCRQCSRTPQGRGTLRQPLPKPITLKPLASRVCVKWSRVAGRLMVSCSSCAGCGRHITSLLRWRPTTRQSAVQWRRSRRQAEPLTASVYGATWVAECSRVCCDLLLFTSRRRAGLVLPARRRSSDTAGHTKQQLVGT